jgi:DNA polymerase I-like protein with 3'-5' exonuclease and polymerase domains
MADSKKRIHPSFSMTGRSRLETREPEMQRLPPRLESTRELMRKMAERNRERMQPLLTAVDFPTLELRILASLMQDPPPDSNQ